MMWGQARASSGVMGVDARMIARVRACITFAPDRSSPTIQPTPHYAEALGLSATWHHVRTHCSSPRPAGQPTTSAFACWS
jgi:hypothetical protein